jgi:hypothetical protein
MKRPSKLCLVRQLCSPLRASQPRANKAQPRGKRYGEEYPCVSPFCAARRCCSG